MDRSRIIVRRLAGTQVPRSTRRQQRRPRRARRPDPRAPAGRTVHRHQTTPPIRDRAGRARTGDPHRCRARDVDELLRNPAPGVSLLAQPRRAQRSLLCLVLAGQPAATEWLQGRSARRRFIVVGPSLDVDPGRCPGSRSIPCSLSTCATGRDRSGAGRWRAQAAARHRRTNERWAESRCRRSPTMSDRLERDMNGDHVHVCGWAPSSFVRRATRTRRAMPPRRRTSPLRG